MYQNDIKIFKLKSGKPKFDSSRDLCRPANALCGQSNADPYANHQNDVISRPRTDPFSPYCLIPLPTPFGLGLIDSSCFRRRNERERERVRCVNEGYIRLKEHLPIENKEKRLSKVETLRCAIEYIKYLQNLLHEDGSVDATDKNVFRFKENETFNSCDFMDGQTHDRLQRFAADGETGSYEHESDYDVLNYSSDFTDMSSDTEILSDKMK